MRSIKYLLMLCCMLALMSCKQEKKNLNVTDNMPNIVWIIAEDIGPHLACYGEDLVHTPAIDLLAEEGVKFTNAFSCSGVGAPGRAALVTGMYPTAIGTHHSKQLLSTRPEQEYPGYNAVPDPYIKAFPEYLKAAGYYTTNARKTNYQFGEPFTIWDDCSIKAHWRNRPEGMPFFSCFTLETTSEINVWPDSTKQRYFEENLVDTTFLIADIKKRPALAKKYFTDPANVKLPPYYPDSPIIRSDIARQRTNISRMDGQVKKIIDQLKEDKLLKNTIIIFMSDNGDALPRSKRWIYDSGTRTPLIIYYPASLKPEVRSDLISFVDLAPTVMQMAGLEVPEHMQGKTIFEELEEDPNEYVFMGRDRIDNRYDMIRGVRSDRYQYIKNFNPETNYTQEISFMYEMPAMKEILRLNEEGKLSKLQSYWLFNPKPDEELYDCIVDPYQVKNLAGDPDYKEMLAKMREELVQWQNTYGDWGFMPEEEQAELMWPNGKQPRTAHPLMQVSDQTMSLSCNTEGATIAYQFQSEGKRIWHIYNEPVKVKEGEIILVKAVRYGYFESRLLSLDLNQL